MTEQQQAEQEVVEVATGSYVLVETLASKSTGRTMWFRAMTGIGPAATSDPDKAYVFSTEEGAKRSPAMLHSLSFYEVRPVGADGVAGTAP